MLLIDSDNAAGSARGDVDDAFAIAALDRDAISEAILVGSNLAPRGRFPPWWPHEFNLTKDRTATRAVFASIPTCGSSTGAASGG